MNTTPTVRWPQLLIWRFFVFHGVTSVARLGGLCPPAHAPANVYGHIIYEHATEVARSSLTDAQDRAVALVLERLCAPVDLTHW
jgi:hypothetical protein